MYVTKVANEKELILNSPHLKRKTAQLNLLQRQKASLKPSDGVNLLSINATPQYKESPPPPPQLSENNQLINVKTKKRENLVIPMSLTMKETTRKTPPRI